MAEACTKSLTHALLGYFKVWNQKYYFMFKCYVKFNYILYIYSALLTFCTLFFSHLDPLANPSGHTVCSVVESKLHFKCAGIMESTCWTQ